MSIPDEYGKNLATKLLSVMNEVTYIQKTGVNKFHNYKYAKESDITEAFSKALIKHRVFMFSSVVDYQNKSFETKKGEHRFLVTVKIQIEFIDADSGEKYKASFYGDGADDSDKGVYKAITGALKYALLKTFMVSTGDDPEQDHEIDQPSKKTQISYSDKDGMAHGGMLNIKAKELKKLSDLILDCKDPSATTNAICSKSNVTALSLLTQYDIRHWTKFLEDKLGESNE